MDRIKDVNYAPLTRRQSQSSFWTISSKWVVLIMITGAFAAFHLSLLPGTTYGTTFTCPQEQEWNGSANKTLDVRFKHHFETQYFIHNVAKRFTAGIQKETISFDEMRGGPKGSPNQNVELHKPFLEFHQYLELAYPLTHEVLEKVVVNDYSLLYTWKGKNASLKPGMLMAHIDVVPVDPNTLSEWKYPPFSGFFNEEEGKIYGRGAMDTKMTLIAIMESVEALLEVGFMPNRTWFLSFGHDEEISGFNGIAYIVDYLKNSLNVSSKGIEFIVDEGQALQVLSSATPSIAATTFAMVGVSEKGYMDLNISLKMKKGGHASLPPAHTGIGILSSIIQDLEAHPFPR
jgi:Gly-Xaa carboxypeptidase